ncbi:unnamed protein product, partial [Discosporangium mesarthrocarpum]
MPTPPRWGSGAGEGTGGHGGVGAGERRFAFDFASLVRHANSGHVVAAENQGKKRLREEVGNDGHRYPRTSFTGSGGSLGGPCSGTWDVGMMSQASVDEEYLEDGQSGNNRGLPREEMDELEDGEIIVDPAGRLAVPHGSSGCNDNQGGSCTECSDRTRSGREKDLGVGTSAGEKEPGEVEDEKEEEEEEEQEEEKEKEEEEEQEDKEEEEEGEEDGQVSNDRQVFDQGDGDMFASIEEDSFSGAEESYSKANSNREMPPGGEYYVPETRDQRAVCNPGHATKCKPEANGTRGGGESPREGRGKVSSPGQTVAPPTPTVPVDLTSTLRGIVREQLTGVLRSAS